MKRVRFLRKQSAEARIRRRAKELKQRTFKTEEEKHQFIAGFNVGFNNGMSYINEGLKKGVLDLGLNGIYKPKKTKIAKRGFVR